MYGRCGINGAGLHHDIAGDSRDGKERDKRKCIIEKSVFSNALKKLFKILHGKDSKYGR